MDKKRHKKKVVFAFLVGLLGSLAACSAAPDGSWRNPFWPKAELRVVEIVANQGTDLIGIKQTVETSNQAAGGAIIKYTFIEPTVSIENGQNLPSVTFNRYSVKYRLSDGTTLPRKEFPLFQAFPAVVAGGGAAVANPRVQIQFKILSTDSDLRAVVYPGNNAPRVSDGVADISIYGKDDGGAEIQLDFSVPLAFQTLVFPEPGGAPPQLAPTPSPSPET